jgi:hypothetical protein
MPEKPKVLENVSPERRPKGTSAIGTKKKQKTKTEKSTLVPWKRMARVSFSDLEARRWGCFPYRFYWKTWNEGQTRVSWTKAG